MAIKEIFLSSLILARKFQFETKKKEKNKTLFSQSLEFLLFFSNRKP